MGFDRAAAPLLALALGALLLAPAWARPAARPWAVAALASLAVGLGMWFVPALWPGPRWIGERWNWSGALLALAATLALAWVCQRRLGLGWAEFGCRWRQAPGSLAPALAASAALLALHAATLPWAARAPIAAGVEGWLYQASLPGLVEEGLFRGLALALADRATPPRWRVAGARIGWGGVAVGAVFVALHGPAPAALAAVLPAAALYLWLRARTGSLVLPVVVHNAANLLVLAAAA